MTHQVLAYARAPRGPRLRVIFGTLLKWCFVGGCGLLIIAVTLPSSSHRGPSRVTQCASNLHQIAIALDTYAAANGGYFPTVPYAPYGFANTGTSPQGVDAATPQDAERFLFDHHLQAGSPLASLWLLPLEGLVRDTRIFVCPVPALKPRPAPLADGPAKRNVHLNFSADDEIGYSLGYPWNPDGTVAATWRPGNRATILMTDIAPRYPRGPSAQPLGSAGTAPLATWVSLNHSARGMNAVYADAHVEFIRPFTRPPSLGPTAAATPVPAVLMVPTRDAVTGRI